MSTAWAAGALLGIAFGGGLLLAWSRLPVRNRPTLEDRLAPYLGAPAGTAATALTDPADGPLVSPFPTLERVLRPYLGKGARWLERVLGGAASVRRRLDQSGQDRTVHSFRIEQLMWAAGAAALAVAVSLAMLAGGYTGSPALLVAFCSAAAVGGVVVRDHRLSASVRRRERRILAEFPTIADLLALAVTAGDGPVTALERVARASRGELAGELVRALTDARAGTSLIDALDRISERTRLTPLARFVDGIAVAVERGTPLADVLRAQAEDIRELHRRSLMETGSRKEILMLVPVVFLVMPVTVVFALYPGLVQISTVVP